MAVLSTQDMVDKYLQAEADVLAGKVVQFNGRRVEMVDLPAITKGRQEWERRLAQEQAAGQGVRRPGYSLATFG